MVKILGIEFQSKTLTYVLIEAEGECIELLQWNRLQLTDTRSRDSLRSFQDATLALFGATNPTLVGIEDKPESGQMRAGAAALKMEGIVLASAPCDVDFVSGKRINSHPDNKELRAYLQPAHKAAIAAYKKWIS